MARSINVNGATYQLSDDGTTVLNGAGSAMPIALLPPEFQNAAEQSLTAPTPQTLSLPPLKTDAVNDALNWYLRSTPKPTPIATAAPEANPYLYKAYGGEAPQQSAEQPTPAQQLGGAGPAAPSAGQQPTAEPNVQPQRQAAFGGYTGYAPTQGSQPFGPYHAASEQAQRDLGETMARAEEGKAVTLAQIGEERGRQSQIITDNQRRQAELEAERQKYYQAETGRIDKLQEDVKAAKIKDPWANRSTGTRIMQGIAIGLGAAGAALTGGENTALQVINQSVDRDLRVQQMNLANKKDSYAESKGMLAVAMKEYGDRQTALQAAHIMGLQEVSNNIDMLKDNATSETTRNNADIIRGQVDLQISKEREGLFAQQQAQRARGSAVATQKALEDYKLNAPVVDARLLNASDRERVAVVDGKAYLVPREQERQSLQDGANEVAGLAADVRKMDEYIASTNPASRLYHSTKKSPEYGEIKATIVQAQMRLKNMWQLGVLSKDDYVKLDAAIPDPTDAVSGASRGKLATMLESTQKNLKNKLNGLQRVENLPNLRPNVRYDLGTPVK